MKSILKFACITVALAWALPVWELVTRAGGFFGHSLGWGYVVNLDVPIAITAVALLVIAGAWWLVVGALGPKKAC